MARVSWTPEELSAVADARELEIASRRADGRVGRWLPIWVVRVDGDVYVRTWYRRSTGWFGQVTQSGLACVRVAAVELDVVAVDIGDTDQAVRTAVDEAYRAKYATHGDATVAGMVTSEAAATTLRLEPAAAGAGSVGQR